jgi:hypothetical protein
LSQLKCHHILRAKDIIVKKNMTNLFLFGSLSFFEGMARMLDLGGTMVVYNDSPTPEEADNRALDSDWRAVGMI